MDLQQTQLDEYFSLVFKELVEELSANSRLKNFTRNSDIIGSYAEASIVRLVKRIVAPYRVSTGGIISPELVLGTGRVPQIDLIIWTPSPLPGLFEVGDFALVPRRSVIGILEIKRSNYSNVGKKIGQVLKMANDLTSDRTVPEVADRSDWVLGLVLLLERETRDTLLAGQIEAGRTVALLEKDGDSYRPNPEGVKRLINFLSQTRARGRLIDGEVTLVL